MSSFNLVDALFQLLSLACIVLIIVLIVSFFRSKKYRKKQLDRIEKKIDDINQRINKDAD
ncbi:DUF4083 domain-containing protein [Niallia sp. Krafla_26]|uniref:DUF4083 domain-containing protein n=1 Tax=Niallia sp. Krafla_26 TaxID=3064703 RepID=UPI003D174708